jgi:hypothetical protein
LYWWYVLEHEDMLKYTLGVLPENVGGTSEIAPSVMTSTSSKKGTKRTFEETSQHLVDQFQGLASHLGTANIIARDLQRQQDTKIELEKAKIKQTEDRNNRESRQEIIDLEEKIDSYEERLESAVNPDARQRLHNRIVTLKNKLSELV